MVLLTDSKFWSVRFSKATNKPRLPLFLSTQKSYTHTHTQAHAHTFSKETSDLTIEQSRPDLRVVLKRTSGQVVPKQLATIMTPSLPTFAPPGNPSSDLHVLHDLSVECKVSTSLLPWGTSLCLFYHYLPDSCPK